MSLVGERIMVGTTDVPKTMTVNDSKGRPVEVPAFYLDEPIYASITEKDIRDGVPRDCNKCTIALALKRQLGVPLVHVGASRAWVALPDKRGVLVSGYGKVIAAEGEIHANARKLIEAVDKKKTAKLTADVVKVSPMRQSERAKGKATKNARNPKREVFGLVAKPKKRAKRMVREQGVRNFSGRTWVTS